MSMSRSSRRLMYLVVLVRSRRSLADDLLGRFSIGLSYHVGLGCPRPFFTSSLDCNSCVTIVVIVE